MRGKEISTTASIVEGFKLCLDHESKKNPLSVWMQFRIASRSLGLLEKIFYFKLSFIRSTRAGNIIIHFYKSAYRPSKTTTEIQQMEMWHPFIEFFLGSARGKIRLGDFHCFIDIFTWHLAFHIVQHILHQNYRYKIYENKFYLIDF